MSSIADGAVSIQTSSESVPAPPSWLGEVTLIVGYLRQHDVLTKISEGVRFARRRFGRYEVIDFVAVLFGYAVSSERTLEAFYQSLQPFAVPFMALFGRDRLPARSTLSRFLADLPEAPVSALRTLFLDDVLSRPLSPEKQPGGLTDRAGNAWVVFDVDGTREAVRQRALPQSEELPVAFRRLDEVCAAGYTGRKRGQVVRTRTVISQAHTYQWLGSFGHRGNGRYREELRQGLAAITRYLTAHQVSQGNALLRLDGQYGTGAVLTDLAGFAFVTRGKDYTVLDHPLVQARLHLPPDQVQQRPESQMVRSLYDCPAVPVGAEGVLCRVVVATHPAGKKKSPAGVTRDGVVYELFFTALPQQGFTACDVVELYLHRGAFEPALADEDAELDPDRWCSHSAWGQEAWQIISQWIWDLRLELGHHLHPESVRTTEFAPALPSPSPHTALPRAMLPHRWDRPGKRVASPVKTLLSRPMGRCGARLPRPCCPMSTAEKPTGVCVWSMEPASVAAVPVSCVSSVNGMAVPRPSRARSACCCTRCRWALPRSSGVIGAAESTGVPACNSCATSAWR